MCWFYPCDIGRSFCFQIIFRFPSCSLKFWFVKIKCFSCEVVPTPHANEWWMWQTFLYKFVLTFWCAVAPLPQFVYKSKFILMKHQWWNKTAEGCCASTLTLTGHPYHRLGINETGTNGLIYVVDSNDRDRIEDAREATKFQGSMVRGREVRISGSQQMILQ